MRKPEQLLWDAMRRNLPKSLDLQRVENLVGEGMPDVYVGASGKWVELKVCKVPKRERTPLLGDASGLRVSQKNWHLKHGTSHAPASFILIRASDRLYLISGRFAPVINTMSLESVSDCSCAHSWDEIAAVLS